MQKSHGSLAAVVELRPAESKDLVDPQHWVLKDTPWVKAAGAQAGDIVVAIKSGSEDWELAHRWDGKTRTSWNNEFFGDDREGLLLVACDPRRAIVCIKAWNRLEQWAVKHTEGWMWTVLPNSPVLPMTGSNEVAASDGETVLGLKNFRVLRC